MMRDYLMSGRASEAVWDWVLEVVLEHVEACNAEEEIANDEIGVELRAAELDHEKPVSLDRPFGQHRDGSITLGPEAAKFLREAMLRRGGGILISEIDNSWLRELADLIVKTQGLEFEQYT